MELEDEKEENVSINDIRLAQKLAGSLIWLSTRTRPDIAYAQHRISSLAVRAPKKALAEGKRVLRYLNGTSNCALRYQQTEVNEISAYGDANFAVKISQSGTVVMLGKVRLCGDRQNNHR